MKLRLALFSAVLLSACGAPSSGGGTSTSSGASTSSTGSTGATSSSASSSSSSGTSTSSGSSGSSGAASTGGSTGGTTGSGPSISGSVANPASLGSDGLKTVVVDYTVTAFTLAAPGACAGAAGCGHVHVRIDGSACNAAGHDFNAEDATGHAPAALAWCLTNTGSHTITLSLVGDDESPVLSGGQPVATDLPTVTQAASPDPAIDIVSPGDGATVTLGSDPGKSVPVYYTVSNFQLAAPGTCPPGNSNCGHIHLVIDPAGQPCNSPGRAYNVSGQTSPVTARLSLCASPAGSHTLQVKLGYDDHSQVYVGGQPVMATQGFVTQ